MDRDGWGSLLPAQHGPSGTWAEGLYHPKWTSTTYTLLLPCDLGLPPTNAQARKACAILLDRRLHEDGGINWMTIAWMPSPPTCRRSRCPTAA